MELSLAEEFFREFVGRFSPGFDPSIHLQRIGVVNQTTMLASDTQAISDFLKQVIREKYQLSDSNVESHFADTRDTLCYATNDNQSAMYGLLEQEADFAIVVGGYNSSNTSHLVELAEEKLPTYFINDASKIISKEEILHFDMHKKTEEKSVNFWPDTKPLRVLITSGASCPDAVVEKVIDRLVELARSEVAKESLMELFV